ncbi:MAG: Hsp70 family protein [Synergistaceae bacterium]|nr:Hsp70 family protein [Synergistaceae bacterium]
MTGINIGVKNIAAAVVKSGKVKLISRREFNNDLINTREDAEIFLDDFCTACVISLSNNININKDNITRLARSAGINNIKIISELDAVSCYIENNFKNLNRALIIDVGAGAAKLNVLELEPDSYRLIEGAVIDSVSGNKFDALIAEWLAYLKPDAARDEKFLLAEAARLKTCLELKLDKLDNIFKLNIYKEDIERLIKFQVRELAHSARRLNAMHRPDKIFVTGGMSKLPILKSELKDILGSADILFSNEDIILSGTALYAAKQDCANVNANANINVKALRDIKLKLVALEYLLNRSQKDRLNNIFDRAERGIANLNLIKSLADELQKAANYYE